MSDEKLTVECPYCSEEILASAKKCRHCGEWLDDSNRRQIVATENQASYTPVTPLVGRANLDKRQQEPKVKNKRVRTGRRPRFGAALIGGFLAGFVAYMLISMMTAEAQMWAFWAGWVVFGFIFLRSGWPTVWFSLSILFFLMPVSVLFFGAATTTTYTSDAEVAGAAIGTALATGTAGIVGFFFGIMFAIMAFFTRQR